MAMMMRGGNEKGPASDGDRSPPPEGGPDPSGPPIGPGLDPDAPSTGPIARASESTGPISEEDAARALLNKEEWKRKKAEKAARTASGAGGSGGAAIATAEGDDDEEDGPALPTIARADAKPRLFHLYKPGQGYWVRLGTALGAGLIAFLTINFMWEHMKGIITYPDNSPRTMLIVGIIAGLSAVFGFIVFRLLNRPNIVDFMIATEGEMKKVNWSTRAELWGSTKVVILFMFIIAAILFVVDIGFGYFFKMIGVLDQGPFG